MKKCLGSRATLKDRDSQNVLFGAQPHTLRLTLFQTIDAKNLGSIYIQKR
jgi:hypothetical protein